MIIAFAKKEHDGVEKLLRWAGGQSPRGPRRASAGALRVLYYLAGKKKSQNKNFDDHNIRTIFLHSLRVGWRNLP